MRADLYLLETGVFDSRAKAQAAIAAGTVRVDGVVLTKPSQKIPAGAVVEAQAPHPWVSRAGLKLVAGLEGFGIDPSGMVCLDIGASTGGFTQVLLSRGAAHVYAVDVGRDQLHDSLRRDPRVSVLEATDARTLTTELIAQPPQLIVCDASFIGLEKVLERPLQLAAAGAHLVALFKPQFQVGRAAIARGGIVKDDAAIAGALTDVRDALAAQGWSVTAQMNSPIRGGDGNRELLLLASRAGA